MSKKWEDMDRLSDEQKAARSRESQAFHENKKYLRKKKKMLRKLDERLRLIAVFMGENLPEVEFTVEMRDSLIRGAYAKIGKPYAGQDTLQSQCSCAGFIVCTINAVKKPRPRKHTVKKIKQTKKILFVQTNAFLNSLEWRKLRYQALKLHGRRCLCCGRSPAEGAIMNVDHVKSRKKYPELALALNNLQVLCGECNHGKGNWDETDWR